MMDGCNCGLLFWGGWLCMMLGAWMFLLAARDLRKVQSIIDRLEGADE